MKVKVNEYTNHNGHISNFMTLKMYAKVKMYNICSGAIQWQIPYFLYDGNSNVCVFTANTWQNSQSKSLTLKI